MTHPDNGPEVGRLLGSVVPDLPAPPDRLAAVGGRVRRRRVRQIMLAAACVTLVLLGTAALVVAERPATLGRPAGPQQSDGPHPSDGPQRPDAGSCPAQLPSFPDVNGELPRSAAGDLAPAGAVRAVLCRYDPVPEYGMVRPGPARQLVLTRDVAGLVAALNRLPAKGTFDPCFSGGNGGYLTLVYDGGTTATIELSNGCGYVRRGGITRYNGWEAVIAFDERYSRQELARSVPDAVPPADCAPRLTPGGPPGRFGPDPVTDVWLHDAPALVPRYLPAPLAVITACRYRRDRDGGLTRTQQVNDRDGTGQTADAVEAAHRTWAGEIPFSGCAADAAIRTVDVLVLRDVVGETLEVRVVRDTCPAVTFGFDGAPPNAAVSAVLDRLLGPPAN